MSWEIYKKGSIVFETIVCPGEDIGKSLKNYIYVIGHAIEQKLMLQRDSHMDLRHNHVSLILFQELQISEGKSHNNAILLEKI